MRLHTEKVVGKQFGEWTVLNYAGNGKYTCKCSCGTIRELPLKNFKSGASKSCGHATKRSKVDVTFIDMTGKQYNEWTVLERVRPRMWLCRCSCGKEKVIRDQCLRNGTNRSCGHDKYAELKGQQFGEWTVLEYLGNQRCLCRCSCGKERDVSTNQLRRGKSKSCGHRQASFIDLTGKQFGEWTALEYISKQKKWLCRCSCGVERLVASQALRTGKTKSCGHLNRKLVNLAGQQFGEWTVLSYAGSSYWLCRCSCGVERKVRARSLQEGISKSCGYTHRKIIQPNLLNTTEANDVNKQFT